MYLVVGLGNPGAEYERTRHNVGFLFVEKLANQCTSGSFQSKFHGLFQRTTWKGHDLILLMPQTFMNRSGISVRECMTFFKIPPEKVIVIFDDLDQEFGAVRMRFGGGHGGHNGVRDILAQIGTDKFHRLKIGIGKPEHKSATVGWVLGKFDTHQETELSSSFDLAEERLTAILKQN